MAEKFAGKSIFGVTEITNSDEFFYLVNLEDHKCWTNVQVNATGQMMVLDKLYKAGK